MNGRVIVAILLAWVCAPAALASGKARTPAGPEVRSASALVVDGENGRVLFERDAARVVPIASITKLMTALVVLDGQQPLDEVLTVTKADVWKGKGAFSRLPVGMKATRGDFLKLALMASENRAAHLLGRHYPGGPRAFVKTMNAKARALGMSRTRFADASGLSNANVSTARDLAKLVSAASRDSRIRDYSTLFSHDVRVNKRSSLSYRNTNLLVGKPDWDILIQKTGYTNDAGQCLVMEAMIEERPVVIVLLNSFGTLTRTADARRIRKWMESRSGSVVAGAAR